MIFKLIANIKMKFIENYTKRRNTSATSKIVQWRQICSLVDDFELNYSLAPFLKVTKDFVEALLFIVYISIQNLPIHSKMTCVVAYFILQLMIDVYVICVIDCSNKELKTAMNSLLENSAIYTNGDLKQLTDDMKQSYRFNLTGYGLFALEKSLIIGFGASLISFTVLFIQTSTM